LTLKLTANKNPDWIESSDLGLAIELCEKFNRGKLYEIFGEYAGLSSRVLVEKGAKCWLCHEDNKLSGFALLRHLAGFNVLEEMWAPFDGLFGDTLQMTAMDRRRIQAFKSQVMRCAGEPLLMRGPIENHFAHGVARGLGLAWFNGLVLGERRLRERQGRLSNPPGCDIRGVIPGDELFFSKLHLEVYSEEFSSEVFRSWATAEHCRCIVATHSGNPVGFIIAEKRPYKSIGDLYLAVSPSHHGIGVGGALLDAAVNASYEMGVRRMIADYRTMNGATHALYEGRGFKPVRVYNYFRVR